MNDDTLDGCDLKVTAAHETSDDQIDALVLFADVDFTDPAAVAARRAEWEALWPSA